MKYKEFMSWCNERACDGMWSMGEAAACIDLIEFMKHVPFWKKRAEWELRKEAATNLVQKINQRYSYIGNGME